MKRKTLCKARLDKGLTQQQVADYLGITLRSYQRIEAGSSDGSGYYIWDSLEDLFSIHQRKLRGKQEKNPCTKDNQ